MRHSVEVALHLILAIYGHPQYIRSSGGQPFRASRHWYVPHAGSHKRRRGAQQPKAPSISSEMAAAEHSRWQLFCKSAAAAELMATRAALPIAERRQQVRLA
jgi:hypothetical protein